MTNQREDAGTTRLSFVVMLVVMAMLTSLLFPAVLRSRESARSASCADNLKWIGLATHNYHSAFKALPMGCGGTDGLGIPENGNDFRLSGFVALLPFMDEQALWSKISRPHRVGDVLFPAMGPVPTYDSSQYPFWAHQVSRFLCPQESVKPNEYGLRSYSHCYGDGIENVGGCDDPIERRAVSRGIFMRNNRTKFRDILDGTSNTIMVGETVIGIGDTITAGSVARHVMGVAESPSVVLGLVDPASRKQFRSDVEIWGDGKGSRWADGSFRISGFNTVLPPNSPSCTTQNEWSGIMSASSHHLDGAFLLMADGAVRFVLNSIDTGDLTQKSVAKRFGNSGKESPYGDWGAMGTRSSKELIPHEVNNSFGNVTVHHLDQDPPREKRSVTVESLIDRLEKVQESLDTIIRRLDKMEGGKESSNR